MVSKRPNSPPAPPLIGNLNSQLGVIVDRSSFDEDDELGFTRDASSVIEEDLSMSAGGAVVMKNGKVRRRLRWKPPSFRRKRNNVSSNMSVISALTTKSTMTNRSNSTNRSFLSHFSRKSQNSFHTFHSTETPVVNNKAGSKNVVKHPLPRPNYRDTFDSKHSTIDSEGKYVHQRMGSDRALPGVDEMAVMDNGPAKPSRIEELSVSPRSPMSVSSVKFDPQAGGAASVNSDPFDSLEGPASPSAPPPIIKPPKAKRPPLFKRKFMKSKERPPSPTEASHASSPSNSISPVAANATVPTTASSGSPLSSPLSLHRENSVLPMLAPDEFEEDRRVALCIGTPPRSTEDYSDDSAARTEPPTEGDSSRPPSSGNETTAQSSLPSSQAAKGSNSPQIPSRVGRPPLGPTGVSPATSEKGLQVPVLPSAVTNRSHSTPTLPRRRSPHKSYNRPVDSTTATLDTGVEMTATDSGLEPKASDNRNLVRRRSSPFEGDDGAFQEAERNLRAIHDMAAEHLAHGEYEEAIEVFEEILRGQQERYGHNHYRVGTALHNLGIVHLKSGDLEKAIEICGEAVDVRRESLVPNHPDVAVSLAQLGVAHLESENFEEALVVFREALHIRRTFLGPRHPKCSKILNNIGCALYSLDELEEARTTFEEALEIHRVTLRMMPTADESHDQTSALSNNILLSMASTLCNIGSIRLRMGHFDEAHVALEEALLIQQSVLGDDHPMVAGTMENIAFVESTRESAIPSANDLLSRWTNVNEESEQKENTVTCASEPNMQEVLNLDLFSSMSPQKWFKKMEDALTDNGCGTQTTATEDMSSIGGKSQSYSDTSGRYSI